MLYVERKARNTMLMNSMVRYTLRPYRFHLYLIRAMHKGWPSSS